MRNQNATAGLPLRDLYGTAPFRDYCRGRGVPFRQRSGLPMPSGGERRWERALAALPCEARERVVSDLVRVGEMADPRAEAFLRRAVPRTPPDDVPAGAPAALWCLLRHPDAFREAFLGCEGAGAGRWRTAVLPAEPKLPGTEAGARAVQDALRAFFGRSGARSPASVVEAVDGGSGGFCCVASIPDRSRRVASFTATGDRLDTVLSRPPLRITFAVGACNTVVLQSPLPPDREEELLRRLCLAVLNVEPSAPADTYDLAPLKGPFRPQRDAPDMESVRLRVLHLRYPGRLARRRLALETLSCDGPFAVEEMLREHVPDAALRASLDVSHAELQVRLRVPGGTRDHAVRLWPDHSNLGPGPLGDRLRSCLRRWGLLRHG